MHPKEGIANSVDPDQTASLGTVWSGSALFAQTCRSENLGRFQSDSRLSKCYCQTSTERLLPIHSVTEPEIENDVAIAQLQEKLNTIDEEGDEDIGSILI